MSHACEEVKHDQNIPLILKCVLVATVRNRRQGCDEHEGPETDISLVLERIPVGVRIEFRMGYNHLVA